MKTLTLEQTQAIFRSAIDASAMDLEGDTWGREVHAEVSQMLAARMLGDAATIIAGCTTTDPW